MILKYFPWTMRTFDAFTKYITGLHSFITKIWDLTFVVIPELDMKDLCTNIVFQDQGDELLETEIFAKYFGKKQSTITSTAY